MARPIIALLTDFGVRDHYAGTMKGVVLGICPDATLVDISHEMPPHDVAAGAIELAATYRYFPPGTIFLVVVDPGVGSSRRGIAAEAGDFKFVAPDNGVLSLVFDEIVPRRVVEISDRRYARPTISRTFEGRDRFAPAAAWLAKGLELTALGRPATNPVRLDLPRPAEDGDGIVGHVIRIDRFGNVVTNIDRALVERHMGSSAVAIEVGTDRVSRLVATYADAPDGELCALFGSSDQLEVAVRGASAAARIEATRGTPVRVRRA